MILIAVLSGSVAAIHFSVVLICLVLSRASEWRVYRVFALITFCMGLYATNKLVFFLQATPHPFIEIASKINVAIGMVVPSLFIVFNRQRDKKAFSLTDKMLLSVLVPLSIVTLVTDQIVLGTQVTFMDSLGLVYQVPDISLLGNFALGTGLLSMLTMAFRYIRKARGDSVEAKLSAAGIVVFVLFAFEELLVSLGVVELPFLADLGFTGLTISFAAELSSRLAHETLLLTSLNQGLEAQVDEHSRDLADTREALFVAERQAAIGQLASGVGHEINNPLAYISGNLSFLRDQGSWDEDETEAIKDAMDGVARMSQIVGDLTMFSGKANDEGAIADVKRSVESAIRISRLQNVGNLNIHIDMAHEGNVTIDEVKFTQVLVNLLVNASQASLGTGQQHISIDTFSENESLVIRVADDGVGIEAAKLGRVFDPLFTTKEVGEGTGLGLYVCKGIIEDVGGTILMESTKGVGTTVTLTLPLTTQPSPVAKQESSREKAAIPDSVRIYIVDDEEHVTRVMQRMLREVSTFVENDSQKALAHLKSHKDYDIVICDLMMPNMTGMEIYETLLELGSPMCAKFLFITGGAVAVDCEEFLESPDINVLFKPFLPVELRSKIDAMLLPGTQ